VLYAGRDAGAPYARGDKYNPTGDGHCIPASGESRPFDVERTVVSQDQCVLLSDDFFQFWLGAYTHVDGKGTGTDSAIPPVTGVDLPFLGFDWTFAGTGVAPGSSADAYVPTADHLGSAYPDLPGHAAARYRGGSPGGKAAAAGSSHSSDVAVVTTPDSVLFGF